MGVKQSTVYKKTNCFYSFTLLFFPRLHTHILVGSPHFYDRYVRSLWQVRPIVAAGTKLIRERGVSIFLFKYQ